MEGKASVFLKQVPGESTVHPESIKIGLVHKVSTFGTGGITWKAYIVTALVSIQDILLKEGVTWPLGHFIDPGDFNEQLKL